VREGELSEDRFMTPDNNSDRSLKAESAQMRYFFEGWLEILALSPVKKESVGLGGQ
jgi:hypothetical protein